MHRHMLQDTGNGIETSRRSRSCRRSLDCYETTRQPSRIIVPHGSFNRASDWIGSMSKVGPNSAGAPFTMQVSDRYRPLSLIIGLCFSTCDASLCPLQLVRDIQVACTALEPTEVCIDELHHHTTPCSNVCPTSPLQRPYMIQELQSSAQFVREAQKVHDYVELHRLYRHLDFVKPDDDCS